MGRKGARVQDIKCGVQELQHGCPETLQQCYLIDWLTVWFGLQKAELLPGLKIHSQADISMIHGRLSTEALKPEVSTWRTVSGMIPLGEGTLIFSHLSNRGICKSLNRVAQVILYPIPVTSSSYVIDVIEVLQFCPNCMAQFCVFHCQNFVSFLRLHLGIEKSKFPLSRHCLPWPLPFFSSKFICQCIHRVNIHEPPS